MSAPQGLAPTPVRFVLFHPRTPENLGAAARALKNFGQTEWTWVRPPWSPDEPRARTLAVGAEDVLGSARLAASLEEAVADCSWVVGTSGRTRLRPPPLDPDAFAAEAARRPGRVALVFGDERTGLRRHELARCYALTRLPSDARQPRSTSPRPCASTPTPSRADPSGELAARRVPELTRTSAGLKACSRTSSGPPGSSVRGGPASLRSSIHGGGRV